MRNELDNTNFISKEMFRQSHKGLVGMLMFCQGCNRCLDFRKAVNISVSKGDEMLTSMMVCTTCWDSNAKANCEKMSADNADLDISFIDGREL